MSRHPLKSPGKSGGGLKALWYVFKKSLSVGFFEMLRTLFSRNACKTCALGMGGQSGGMKNEVGSFPEVCKKSVQAQASDLQSPVPNRFFIKHSVSDLQNLSPRELETAGRLTHPLILREGATHYQPIAWHDAFQKISEQIKKTPPERGFFYSSGRSSNEAGFLMQLFARAYGTNHVNNCSYYCHQASGVGLGQALGTGTATLSLQDLEHSDLLVLIGGNPASNHPRLMTEMMKIRRRGGQVLVINPLKEPALVKFNVPSDPISLFFGSKIPSLYLQPRIGGDIAVLTGMAKTLLEKRALEESFVSKFTEGASEWIQFIEKTSWEKISNEACLPEIEIRKAAEIYSQSKNTVFAWTMGITHHTHGVENVRCIVNLALMRGMVGRKSAGLLPIRGHSNVQGMGTIGVTPKLKEDTAKRFASELGIQIPNHNGMDTMGCMEASEQGKMDFAFCLGGNLFGSNPDSTYAHRAFGKIPLVAYLNTTLNTGHAWGLGKETIVLPVYARDEEPEPTTQESMFSYVRLSNGGIVRHQGLKSEIQILSAIAEQTLGNGGPIPWKNMKSATAIRKAIATTVPGLEAIGEIHLTKKEFEIKGRIFHEPVFNTPTKKAQFFTPIDLAEKKAHPHQLMLMTIRSEGQFNTVVYEENDVYRGQDRRDIILMNEADIQNLNLQEEELVEVWSDTGNLKPIRIRPFDIAQGQAAMYYPEANTLVGRTVDPLSYTPAFKAVPISLKKISPP